MRKYLLLAATAAAATGAPAYAAADGPYVGIEGGVVFPRTTDFDVSLITTTPPTSATYNDGVSVDYKTGWGVDAIAGYKLGLFRLEAEGGYQRAPVKDVAASSALLTDATAAAGAPVLSGDFGGSRLGVTTLMANALLDGDFGGGLGGYVGGGAGRAWASYSGDKDNAWAYQGIAGVRYGVTPNVDVGLKYRYLRTAKLQFDDSFAVNGTTFDTTSKGNYASHSLLASLVYNFNSAAAAPAPVPAAEPAPPPPPAAPATQTCPDGSVIPATSACPAPPPPPPPAPVERGERG